MKNIYYFHHFDSGLVLNNIAERKPTSILNLLDIKGLGKKTIKKFGEEIIELINKLY